MKKVIVILVTFVLVFVTGCTQKEFRIQDNCSKTNDSAIDSNIENMYNNNDQDSHKMDLNAILEVDSSQLSIGVELNHKNLISDKPQHFSTDDAHETIELTIDNAKYDLIYKDTLYYPVGEKTVHKYLVDGDESKPVLVDEKGNINSILYKYVKLGISQNALPEEILEPLKNELAKILDISYYKNIKMSDSKPITEGFGIYDYVFYNNNNDYMTDYLVVSVSDDGCVLGLKINNQKTNNYELNIDKDKENAIIEFKLKDIYNTDTTQYKSYSMSFDPCIVQYNGQIYVQYFVSAKYLNTSIGEMDSYLNNILISLNELSN